jgi:myo-inositol-1-phosphate synthase
MILYKNIKNKQKYLKYKYPFKYVPKLTDKKLCIHCNEEIIVGDYKVEILNNEEYIICPNSPNCDGTVIDWFDLN